MHRLTAPVATGTLLLALTVPAAGAAAADGTAPLKVSGEPSRNAQLAFPLPDGWSNDLWGPALNRGVYGRDLKAGDATCQVTVVTRGEARRDGIESARPLVNLRFGGGRVSFRAIEQDRSAEWYRSGTSADDQGWKATGTAELSTPRFVGAPAGRWPDDRKPAATIMVTQARATAFGVAADGVTTRDATDAERAQCATQARGEIARGLRSILTGTTIVRR